MSSSLPSRPVPEARRQREQRILDVAASLASQGGFEAVQMRTVADQADVALGTLYRYFPSKIHLLVSALRQELHRAEATLAESAPVGPTAADRVVQVLRTAGRRMRHDQHLAEALVRAFMFADSSAASEIVEVEELLTTMVARAMHPEQEVPGEDSLAVAKVIADVWLAALIAWVTGRSTLEEAGEHMRRAVTLVLRD
ncbi:TetR family transcriptional regulator [Nocardioides sp. 616]|uniref:TetR family transcriptional regulator n=1 Tax=Nocardioides sp. 616 TaxID=2268090 RepID=UPI000CE32EFE|nr:TetR family transcriptional regulator [Nocardioides sp. 616]